MPVRKYSKAKARPEQSLAEVADARPAQVTRPWTLGFLHALAECGSVTKAAKSVGVSVPCVYDHRHRDEGFAAAWDEAYRRSAYAIRDRAHEWVEKDRKKHHFYKGKLVTVYVHKETGEVADDETALADPDNHVRVPYTESTVSLSDLLRMLEARLPEEFGPRQLVTNNVTVGKCKVYVIEQPGDLTPEDLV